MEKARPGGRKIESIHAADVGDALAASPSLSSFSCSDNVLVMFEKGDGDKKNEFKVFAGSKNKLLLCRLTPHTCSASIHAACCWSELQDYFAIVMGPEFQNYEMTALTLFRNDQRSRRLSWRKCGACSSGGAKAYRRGSFGDELLRRRLQCWQTVHARRTVACLSEGSLIGCTHARCMMTS